MKISDDVLLESKAARDNQLANLQHDKAKEILAKVKTLLFSLWEGTGRATTEQVAEFYNVSTDTVKKIVIRNRQELETDGYLVLSGFPLKSYVVRDKLSLTNKVRNLALWTPRATLRLGMLLRDSEEARQVRTTLLNVAEAVPAFNERLRELELENENLKLRMQLTQIKQEHHPNSLQSCLKNALLLENTLTEHYGIEPEIARQMGLNSVARLHPSYAPEMEKTKDVISAAKPLESVGMNATELGKILTESTGKKISNVKANLLLEAAGLQFKLYSAGKKEKWRWDLTDSGKQHGHVYFKTGQKNTWSGTQILWQHSVVELVEKEV